VASLISVPEPPEMLGKVCVGRDLVQEWVAAELESLRLVRDAGFWGGSRKQLVLFACFISQNSSVDCFNKLWDEQWKKFSNSCN
jgi:hypothetical protein